MVPKVPLTICRGTMDACCVSGRRSLVASLSHGSDDCDEEEMAAVSCHDRRDGGVFGGLLSSG